MIQYAWILDSVTNIDPTFQIETIMSHHPYVTKNQDQYAVCFPRLWASVHHVHHVRLLPVFSNQQHTCKWWLPRWSMHLLLHHFLWPLSCARLIQHAWWSLNLADTLGTVTGQHWYDVNTILLFADVRCAWKIHAFRPFQSWSPKAATTTFCLERIQIESR